MTGPRITSIWAAMFLATFLLAVFGIGPAQAATTVFSDGFENAATVQDLLQPGRWSYLQQENPDSSANLSTAVVHSGAQAIEFFGHPSYSYSSITKSDIAWTGMRFRSGDLIEIESWFYIERAADPSNLYLIDAECRECGTQSPGIRIRLTDGYPEVERSKILRLPTVTQRHEQVPVQRWWDLRFRIRVGLGPLGHMWIWLDGTKVIDRAGTTVFPGGFIDSVQVGLTANASRADAELCVDDVDVVLVRRPTAAPTSYRPF